jgi:hypothetical protein
VREHHQLPDSIVGSPAKPSRDHAGAPKGVQGFAHDTLAINVARWEDEPRRTSAEPHDSRLEPSPTPASSAALAAVYDLLRTIARRLPDSGHDGEDPVCGRVGSQPGIATTPKAAPHQPKGEVGSPPSAKQSLRGRAR